MIAAPLTYAQLFAACCELVGAPRSVRLEVSSFLHRYTTGGSAVRTEWTVSVVPGFADGAPCARFEGSTPEAALDGLRAALLEHALAAPRSEQVPGDELAIGEVSP